MQRRLIIAALVVLVWLQLALAGDAPPGFSPEATQIMEKMQAGQMPTAEEMKIFEQATQDMAASIQGLAPTVPTQGKSLLDLSDGYDPKIEFPKWPDIATFDQSVAGEAVIRQWAEDARSWLLSLPLTPAFEKKTGNWVMFEGAGRSFSHDLKDLWREHHERQLPINEKKEQGDIERGWNWTSEYRSLGERQGKESLMLFEKWDNIPLPEDLKAREARLAAMQRERKQMEDRHLGEQKQLQIEHCKRALAAERSYYADSYNNWKNFRDAVFDECPEYYSVCASQIAKISHLSAENRAMNCIRAGTIVSAVLDVAKTYPAWLGGRDLKNGSWLRPGPLTFEELEKLFLEPGAPQAGNARWRIPSTPGFDDPLRPLDPVPDKGPPDPLAPLPPVLDKGPPDPLAPLDPLPTKKPAPTKTKKPAKTTAKPRPAGR